MKEIILTWKKASRDYARKYERLEKEYHIYSFSSRELVRLANIRNVDSVLDLGCGTGISSEQIYRRIKNYGKLIGIDPSPSMLEIAHEKFEDKKNVRLILSDAFEFLIRNRSIKPRFNVILANFSYWYFGIYPQLFKNVYAALEKNGKFVFNVTPYLSSFNFKSKKFNLFADIFSQHIHYILSKRNYFKRTANHNLPSYLQLNTIDTLLKRLGFSTTYELVSLPLTVEDALDFTYEGFWKLGLAPTHGPLLEIPLKERIQIYKEVINRAKLQFKRTKIEERPKIFNVLAEK